MSDAPVREKGERRITKVSGLTKGEEDRVPKEGAQSGCEFSIFQNFQNSTGTPE